MLLLDLWIALFTLNLNGVESVCLILLAFKVDQKYPLIVAANRDEYFARPTNAAHYWMDHPNIFGGRDLEELGTWMGVTTTGRFAAVANWSRNEERASDYRSRGELVRDFLLTENKSLEYVRSIPYSEYRGCNLIVYDGVELAFWSNHENFFTEFNPGYHVLTNANLDNNSPRAKSGFSQFKQLATKHEANSLLELLGPKEPYQDGDAFVMGDTYGTRSSTTLFFSTTTIVVNEQQYGPRAKVGTLIAEEIALCTR